MRTMESAMADATLVPAGSPAHRCITPALGAVKWCGPSAVSSVTGCTSELARLLIAAHRYGPAAPERARYVKGTYVRELEYALRALGWDSHCVTSGQETFARFLDWTADDESAFIVLAGRHFIVSQRGRVADRLVDGGLCKAHDASKRRAVVLRHVRVWRCALVDFGALERAVLKWCAEAKSGYPGKSSKAC